MIIDFHTHLVHPDLDAQPFWDAWVATTSLITGRPAEKIIPRLPQLYDITGDVIVQDMDKAGIDKSVLIANDWGMARHAGEPKMSIEQINRAVADAAIRHPGRIIPCCGIDPRRPFAAKFIEKCLTEWNMKIIKIHPISGFYPNDKICYPIYELAEKYQVPVIFHTGEMLAPFYFKYCEPIHLQEVVMDFPNVNFVFAHSGGIWMDEAIAICANTTNVWLDVSLWQTKLFRPMDFYRPLKKLINSVPAKRIMFGSDGPMFRLAMPNDKFVKAFTEFPDQAKAEGLDFPKEIADLILGGNAVSLLKLA